MNLEAAVKELREEGYLEGELSVDPLWYIIWEPENLEEYNKYIGRLQLLLQKTVIFWLKLN